MRGSRWPRLIFVAGFICQASPAVAVTVFSDSMSSGVNGWTASGLWHQTTRRASSPTTSWWYGQESILNYNTGVANSGNLDSPVINLVGYYNGQLTFQAWWQTEQSTFYDKRQVYAKSTDTVSWTLLWSAPAADQLSFTPVTVSLPAAYNGKQFQLRFAFDTVDSAANTYEGWYTDDVQVTGTPVDAIPPAAPTGLGAGAGGGEPLTVYLTLSWTSNTEADLQDYRLYRSTAAGVALVPSNRVAAVLAPGTTHRDGGLGEGTTFYYRLAARDFSLNESGSSTEVSGVYRDTFPPAVPGGLGVVNLGIGGVLQLSWGANTEVDMKDYGLYRGLASGALGTKTLLARVASPGTTYQDGGLTNGTTYYYQLTARDTRLNESGGSAEVSRVPAGVPYTVVTTTYAWADAVTGGTTVADGNHITQVVTLPFAFPFYSTPYTSVVVCDQGYLTFGTADVWATNTTIPAGAAPNGYIAPFWSHLHPIDGGGKILFKAWTSSAAFTWNGVYLAFTTTPETFQIILYSDGRIVCQYASLGGAYSETVGVENLTGTYGTQYAYNTTLTSPLAIQFGGDTTPPAIPAGLGAGGGGAEANGVYLDLTWAANTEGDLRDYRLYRGTSAGVTLVSSSVVVTILAPGTTHRDRGLVNGATYYYRLTARDGSGNESAGSSEISGVFRDTVAPAVPGGLGATDVPGDQGGVLRLSWTANTESDLKDYGIYRATLTPVGVGPGTLLGRVAMPGTTRQDGGLLNGATYYYRLTARDVNLNESAGSAEASSIPYDNIAPAVPAGLGIADPGTAALNFSWAANTEVDLKDYRLYRSTNAGVTLVSSHTAVAVSAPGTTCQDGGLTQGLRYFYRLTARDVNLNESGGSAEVSGVPGPPAPPGAFGVVSGGSDGAGIYLHLTWLANTEPDLLDYRLWRSTNAGVTLVSSHTVAVVLAPGTTHRDRGLTDGVTHYFRLTARDVSLNESGASSEASGLYRDTIPPAAPIGGGAADAPLDQGGVLRLSWTGNPEPDVKDYGVFRATWSSILSAKILLTRIVSPGTTHEDRGLSNGATYYYRMTARDLSLNESGGSSEFSGIPYDNIPPATPALGLADPGTTVLNPSWTANLESDLKDYRLYRSTNAGVTLVSSHSVTTITAPGTTHQDAGITTGTAYFYRLTARDISLNESPGSVEVWGVPGAPAAPAAVGISNTAAGASAGGRLTLSWLANFEADLKDYGVYRATWSGAGPAPARLVARVVAPGTTHQDTGLVNGATWYYQATARDTSLNESPGSSEVSAFPQDVLAPAAPAGLVVADVPADQGGALRLNWTANPEADLKDYGVFRATVTGALGTKALGTRVAAGGTTHQDAGLNNGATYYYQLTARDVSLNESAGSGEASSIPYDNLAPAVPTGLSISDPGTTFLNFAWVGGVEADLKEYRLYRSTNVGVTLVSSQVAVAILTPGTTHQDGGLARAQRYNYRLTARDASLNESAPTAEVWSVPGAPVPPTGLGVVSGGNPGSAVYLNLAWAGNAEPDLADYRLWRSTNAGVTLVSSHTVATVLAPGTTHRDAILSLDTVYFYRLTARDTALNESGASSEILVNPAGGIVGIVVPAQPSVAFSDTMEGGVNGWTATGLWHQDTRRAFGGAGTSWWYGRAATGTYDTGAPNTGILTSPAISLPAATTIQLAFQSWYQTEPGIAFDKKLVYISSTNGTTWNLLTQVSGTSDAWVKLTVAISSPGVISAYAGKLVQFRFVFDTVDAANNAFEGWYVDDVIVTYSGPAVPQGLGATVGGPGILRLAWTANIESDLKDYGVYRGISAGYLSTKILLTRVLSPGSTHHDSGLENGKTYYYQLTARDSALNESAGSGEVIAAPSTDAVVQAGQGATVTIADRPGTQVIIGRGAFPMSVRVRIAATRLTIPAEIVDAADAAAAVPGGPILLDPGLADTVLEINVTDFSGKAQQPLADVTLIMPFTRAKVSAERVPLVRIYRLDESARRWELASAADRQAVDVARGQVSAPVRHFSVFRLAVNRAPSAVLDQVRVFPNPVTFASSVRKTVKLDQLTAQPTVRIYTLTGELVREIPAGTSLLSDGTVNAGNTGVAEWGGTNADGEAVALGTYVILVTDSQGGRVVRKLAVLK